MTQVLNQEIQRIGFENAAEIFENLVLMLQSSTDHWVVDLSFVQFIDSAGLAMLVELYKLASRQHKTFSLRLSPSIVKMLKFYELESLLDELK